MPGKISSAAASTGATLGRLMVMDPQEREKMRQLMATVAENNAARFVAESDLLRGAREGRIDPRMEQSLVGNAEQALADRYGWGADIAENSAVGPLALAPPIAYEAVKAALPGVLPLIGKVLPQGEEMAISSKSSPASMQNVAALLAGYADARNRAAQPPVAVADGSRYGRY